MSNQVWTISNLLRYLKDSLENDMMIQSILVKGEISNFTHHRSGHLYFSLKDATAKMNCVMFASYTNSLKIIPKEGMKVIIQAKISLYEPQGNLQLYVTGMQSDGIGDLYLQFDALKKKLSSEGFFDPNHKKQIPIYPKSIGVISAKTGAAIQDVLSIIARRWSICDVKLYPSLVQGDSAAANIIERLQEADQGQHDVILLVRGGGSLEDLWCFNNESLAKAIYHMNTCLVSGVGHETDTTLIDYVSDYRAPTPSAAAEYVTPNKEDVKIQLNHYKQRISQMIMTTLKQKRTQINLYQEKNIFRKSDQLIQNDKMRLMMTIKGLEQYKNQINVNRQRLMKVKEKLLLLANSFQKDMQGKKNTASDNLIRQMQHYIELNQKQVSDKATLLDAFSPLKILSRGYAIAMFNKKAIRCNEDVDIDDVIEVQVSDGKLLAKVTERKF